MSKEPGTSEYTVVGKSLPRVDGFIKATGQARYTDDLSLPGMLYGKMLRSPFPHAKILHIDTSRAEKLPGVKAVITGKDTPGVQYGFADGLPPDKYPLATDKVRFIGDEVAAVAAIDEDTAEEALNLIKLEYELLQAVFDPIEAMKDGAPELHEELLPSSMVEWDDLGLTPRPQPYKIVNNIAATYSRSHGDIDRGFREADYIRADRFVIPATAHGALEPHTVIASSDHSGNLQVWVCNQGYIVKRQWLAATLGIPLNKIRILKSYVGGAFGGKIMLFSHDFSAALLSRKTAKPVKITLSAEEVFTACYQDQRMIIELKTGVKKNGILTAREMKTIMDAGGYRGTAKIASWLTYYKSSPVYDIPNVKYDAICVYTNKSFCGPKRGHGTPQVVFAVESQMDTIAGELGLDPVELRLKNVRKEGATLPNGDKLLSCGMTECIEKAAESAGWEVKRGKVENRGIGIGVSAAQSGSAVYPYGSAATVKLDPEGLITLFTGTIETGQASNTAMLQIAAEELGVSPEDIYLVSADSELCSIDLGNFSMGGTHSTGEAVRLAAADARRQLLERASKYLGIKVDECRIMNKSLFDKLASKRLATFSEVLRSGPKEESAIIGKGYCRGGPSKELGRHTDAYVFTVAVAEVEIDRETGNIKLLKVIITHDSGTAINPVSVEGQAEGQVVMGQGDMLFEEILNREGQILNPSFVDYGLPGPEDAAEIKFIGIETFEPTGPFGAKQAGECARPPIMAAIANAIYHAIKSRFNNLPITADKVLAAIKQR